MASQLVTGAAIIREMTPRRPGLDQRCRPGEGAQEDEEQQLLGGSQIELAQPGKFLGHVVGVDDLQAGSCAVFRAWSSAATASSLLTPAS